MVTVYERLTPGREKGADQVSLSCRGVREEREISEGVLGRSVEEGGGMD